MANRDMMQQVEFGLYLPLVILQKKSVKSNKDS